MSSFVLFSPHSPADCAERLRAALGPGREPLVTSETAARTWPAYGDVTGPVISIARAPGTLLGNKPKPTRLLARMAVRNGGTEIRGKVHPPTWAVTFFLIWLLIAMTVVLHCLIPAMQELFGDFGHAAHLGMHDFIVTVVLPVAGFALLLGADGRWRAQAHALIDMLADTLDATRQVETPRRGSHHRTPTDIAAQGT